MDVVTAVWSAADLLPVRPGTGAAYQALFLALRRVILGRTLTTEVAGKPLRLTVHDVVSVLDPVHLIKGRLDVRVSLSGIRWDHYDFDPPRHPQRHPGRAAARCAAGDVGRDRR